LDNESRQQKKPRRDKRLDTTPLSGPPIWSFERAQRLWTGLGARQLLDQPLTAFFASRQCPGTAIRAAIDWALEQASARRAVVGGFHSPLEQSVLRLLLEAHSPVVVVLARPVTDARLKPEWETAIAGGSMAVVSCSTQAKRLTTEEALERNELAAQLAERIVIAHVSKGGSLAGQAESWASRGLPVLNLAHNRSMGK
jgi:predicted Rossmann fold nucleotide-binding protein DprA/Smf involved in DNA uptake